MQFSLFEPIPATQRDLPRRPQPGTAVGARRARPHGGTGAMPVIRLR
jgi:hypothetical protein